jgi:phosphate transport system permease protein
MCCQIAGLSIILLSIALIVVLVWQSLTVLARAGSFEFFTSSRWIPDPPPDQDRLFGSLTFIFGTLTTSALAMLVAIPLGIGAAAYLAEIASPPVRRIGSFLVELLAAIPSVVYGFWGLHFLGPVVKYVFTQLGAKNSSGLGIVAAGLILAIMIIPYIIALSFDICRAVPRSQREGALALGATRWQTIRSAVLPFARPGIVAACFLALGRALGETMAVTMLIGNTSDIEWSLFAKGNTIASIIANQLNEATSSDQRSALVGLGLILFAITGALNIAARLLIRRVTKPRKSTRHSPSAVPTPEKPPTSDAIPATDVPVSSVMIPSSPRRAVIVDRLMTFVLGSCLALTLGPLFLILGYVAYRGVSSLNIAFFVNRPGPMGTPGYGMGHAIVGSAILVAIATLAAVPIGLLTAIYLAEYSTAPLTKSIRFVSEVLGGVPSIIIGIFAYAVLVRPPWADEPWGFSAWAGAFALGVMMIPIVVRTSEEAMKLVPQSLRHASFALGGSYWQTVVRVTVPASLPAIITGIFLAIGRIAGETAPLLLTALGSGLWPSSLNEPTPFLPFYIYRYGMSGDAEWEGQAWAAALVLLVFVMALNIGIRALTGKRVVAASRAD